MEDDYLVKRFSRAADHALKLAASLSHDQLLLLYGLYKQATVGPNTNSKPSLIRPTDRRKWVAWSSHGNKSQENAMAEYVSVIEQYDPEFSSEKESDLSASTDKWAHVSSFAITEPDVPESEKTIFDWVKENDYHLVKEYVETGFDLKAADDGGLTALHWASDRGHLSIVKLLLDAGVDPNCRDYEGQTPLHYAASCGHADVARALVSAGADAGAVDDEGYAPSDLDLLLEKR